MYFYIYFAIFDTYRPIFIHIHFCHQYILRVYYLSMRMTCANLYYVMFVLEYRKGHFATEIKEDQAKVVEFINDPRFIHVL